MTKQNNTQQSKAWQYKIKQNYTIKISTKKPKIYQNKRKQKQLNTN